MIVLTTGSAGLRRWMSAEQNRPESAQRPPAKPASPASWPPTPRPT